MAVWEYKIISSGKGGFANPALLETFLNQLGTDEWEIVEFRGQPDNPLAFSGLARRPTQRDWTLGDAAAAAARVEADKLREEFEAKFRSATSAAAPAAAADAAVPEAGRETDGLRRLRDTERDADPDAPEDEWDKIGAEEELPTFFEAMRPHLRRNQRGPGLSVGVDYLAKKWDIAEADVLGALKECGLEVPEDEDAKPVYVDYDGDLYWVNVNRRGELWVNTKEKSRPVFRTVQGTRVEGEEAPAGAEPSGGHEERKPRSRREEPAHDPSAPSAPLPEGAALLDRIRPLMRKNRREPGGSGSMSFLSRALKCTETDLIAAFVGLGLAAPGATEDPQAYTDIGDETWWLNKDSRGGVWINAREKRSGDVAGAPSHGPEGSAPAPGNVFAAVRLLLKETKTGAVAAPVERLAGELGKPVDELLGALTSSGLRVPEKSREKPVFAEHAGEIFWLNLNGKGELWLNAKESKYSNGKDDSPGGRPRKGKKDAAGDNAPAAESPEAAPAEPAPGPA